MKLRTLAALALLAVAPALHAQDAVEITGRFVVSVLPLKDGRVKVTLAPVQADDQIPTPGPVVDPPIVTPPPAPKPVATGKLWTAWIYSKPADATQEAARFREAIGRMPWQEIDAAFRAIEINDPYLDEKKLRPWIKDKPLPYFLVVEDRGAGDVRVLPDAVPIGGAAAMFEAVKALRGTK